MLLLLSMIASLGVKVTQIVLSAPYKKVHDNQFLLLKQPFLHPFMIFKSFLTSIILSTDFLIHSNDFVDSYKDCG